MEAISVAPSTENVIDKRLATIYRPRFFMGGVKIGHLKLLFFERVGIMDHLFILNVIEIAVYRF